MLQQGLKHVKNVNLQICFVISSALSPVMERQKLSLGRSKNNNNLVNTPCAMFLLLLFVLNIFKQRTPTIGRDCFSTIVVIVSQQLSQKFFPFLGQEKKHKKNSLCVPLAFSGSQTKQQENKTKHNKKTKQNTTRKQNKTTKKPHK